MRKFVQTGVRSCQTAGRRSFSALVLADHDNTTLGSSTFSAVTAAQQFGDVTVLVAGEGCGAVAEQAAGLGGVAKVLKADNAIYGRSIAENVTPLAVQVSKDLGATHIVAGDSSSGKNTLPRIAAKLDVAQISDVLKIRSDSEFDRPMYAGNVIATVESSDPVKVLTVRSTCFPAAEGGGSAAIEDVAAVSVDEKTKFEAEMPAGGDGPTSPRRPRWSRAVAAFRAATTSRSWRSSLMRWGTAPWAPPGPRSTPGSAVMTCRWARQGRLLPPTSTWRAASPVPSSTSRA